MPLIKDHLIMVSRKSRLAQWQAQFVKKRLQDHFPKLQITIKTVTTEGDEILDRPLAKIGGKGLFVKELETQLLNHKADIAVHSMKDVPSLLPEGLLISAILERADPRDVFVSEKYLDFESLPKGAIIGTSSLRRQAQVLALYPNLNVVSLRGNVDTRIQKLENGEYDAIILAAAGLERLNLTQYLRRFFSPTSFLPGVGQGALGVECRVDDVMTQALLKPLHHFNSAQCVFAERHMNSFLGGSCLLPVAALAEINPKNKQLTLQGLVASGDGQQILKAKAYGKITEALGIGKKVAELLLALGARKIIEGCF